MPVLTLGLPLRGVVGAVEPVWTVDAGAPDAEPPAVDQLGDDGDWL